MATTYPGTIQSITDYAGTVTLANADHANWHATQSDTIEAIETVLGTTAGTSVLKNFAVGDLATRVNSSNVLQHNIQGTINSSVLGTPTFTLGSDSTGDIFYRSSGGTVSRLPIGTNGQMLTTNGTTPSWGAGNTDGWSSAGATWTRTGNHTFTVSGDVTSIYQKGTKIRYKDGGSYEYGVVILSTYSDPNTTVTLATNSDYAMAATTITDNYYSYMENPQGYPDTFNFSVTGTWNGTPPGGTKTQVAKFSVKGRTCFMRYEENNTVAGTTNGVLNFTGPIPCSLGSNVYHAAGAAAMSTTENGNLPDTFAFGFVYGTAPQIYLSLVSSINCKSVYTFMSYPI